MNSRRRLFLQSLAGAGLVGSARDVHAAIRQPFPIPKTLGTRLSSALIMREHAAQLELKQPPSVPVTSGDETNLPGYVGCFTKGLPHDQTGLVDSAAYASLLHALSTGQHADFEAIDRGSGMKLINPEASYTYELEGLDSHQLDCPPAPPVAGPQSAGEVNELYWQALTRDVPFADYGTSALIQMAAQELSHLSAFYGPKDGNGLVTSKTIFRGPFPGCLDGPYLSQFLAQSVPTLSTWLDQKYRIPIPHVDFLDNYPEWLLLQSGLPPYRTYVFDSVPHYIRDGRGLAEWVHYDFLYQAFHSAALILLNQGPESILNANPYYNPTNPYKTSKVQTGFATFGAPHICSWLGRVTTAALQAAWYQKWCVHRRLRPEEFGGLVHQTKANGANYGISSELLNSTALAAVYKANGNYLLPQAFPEGCPLHPSYPAGHATVAGACSIVLKAFFDENEIVTNAVVSTSDGTTLTPYAGDALTVGGEINKLAWNVAIGRNFASIHYRSDAMAGFVLGENVAIAKLQDLSNILTETFPGFHFTRLDGTPVTIAKE